MKSNKAAKSTGGNAAVTYPAPIIPKDREHRLALRTLNKLRGTILGDLKAMRDWAAEYDRREEKRPGAGALNFSLALTALVACESLGYFVAGAKAHRRAQSSHRSPDVGMCISQIVQNFFPPGSRFKYIDKILADYLRHTLVHGFGSRPDKSLFDIHLFVSPTVSRQVEYGSAKKKGVLKINSVALADHVVYAFDRAEKRLSSVPDLRAEFNKAKKLRFPVGIGVNRQFEAFQRKFGLKRGIGQN